MVQRTLLSILAFILAFFCIRLLSPHTYSRFSLFYSRSLSLRSHLLEMHMHQNDTLFSLGLELSRAHVEL